MLSLKFHIHDIIASVCSYFMLKGSNLSGNNISKYLSDDNSQNYLAYLISSSPSAFLKTASSPKLQSPLITLKNQLQNKLGYLKSRSDLWRILVGQSSLEKWYSAHLLHINLKKVDITRLSVQLKKFYI